MPVFNEDVTINADLLVDGGSIRVRDNAFVGNNVSAGNNVSVGNDLVVDGNQRVSQRARFDAGTVSESNESNAVDGRSVSGIGVFGSSRQSDGVFGETSGSSSAAVRGRASGEEPFVGFAGLFEGKVDINGPLTKDGGGFKIDHPLDPTNKYLLHSFVESPEMKNIYDGVAALDEDGSARVEMPEWFGELNSDFRYQLTAIGTPAPALHVAEELSDNRFQIAGGKPGMKVSWQVTGVRQDRWAIANRLRVEEDKAANEQGTHRHPELYSESLDQVELEHTL
jgi:hypothetical protein